MIKFKNYEYKRPNEAEIKASFDNLIDKFNKASSADEQIKLIKDINHLQDEIYSLSAIAEIRYDINTTDSFYEQEKAFWDNFNPTLASYNSKYADALLSSKYRKELKERFGTYVFTKYELTLVSNCIDIYNRGGVVKKSYMELLEGFDALGNHKSKQLLDTLSTFVLDAGMNSANTSKFMDIHNNTVQYRLKKINEVLGVEITGHRVIPGLTMALALKRISEASS